MEERHRVLVISHGHPEINPGGGERAAYDLFRELKSRPGVHAMFLARHDGGGQNAAVFSQFSPDGSEVLMNSECEFFRFSQRDVQLVCRDFRGLLEWYRPTVVHLHHFVHLGLEVIREIKNYSPSVPIVLTLHEYLGICNNNGQMIRTRGDELCRRATPGACHRCFPDVSPQNFFLRELFIKSFFSLVDAFVSPSQFLIDRYVAWGLPREKFVLIENGQPALEPAPARPLGSSGTRGRFAFFGQIQRYKGLQVLLEAMTLLPKALRGGLDGISLDVHGAHLAWQSAEYQSAVHKKLERTRQYVRMHGGYDHADVASLMSGVDWVVVPSIWWENSPLVIQEAFAHGRPVICSDIGGMVEKVRHGENGLHFRVGNAQHLAERLVEAATTPALWDRLRAGIRPGSRIRDTVDKHLEIYDGFSPYHRVPVTPSLRVV
ncbi:MAG TPA: glycosyltransferase family 4 protein [Polyangiaceae bacterium]|nr:glycosyltransferase family 4 protein [Polyangiaceae bacterium]